MDRCLSFFCNNTNFAINRFAIKWSLLYNIIFLLRYSSCYIQHYFSFTVFQLLYTTLFFFYSIPAVIYNIIFLLQYSRCYIQHYFSFTVFQLLYTTLFFFYSIPAVIYNIIFLLQYSSCYIQHYLVFIQHSYS